MNELVQVAKDVYTISEFLTQQECAAWISRSEDQGFDAAPINTSSGAVIEERIRNNDRVLFDSEEDANGLWKQVADRVPHPLPGWAAIGINERIRFYRYDVGQRFRWHADGCYRRDNGEQSLVTFMVYLNDDFEGGETTFHDKSIKPETGMALLFSHWLKHMGSEIRSGRKYVLRSDIMFAKHRPQ